MKNIDLKINNGFARFVMDEKLTILDANNICAIQLNLNKVKLRAGVACLSEVLSQDCVDKIKGYAGGIYGKTLEFTDTIVSESFNNGEDEAKQSENTYQMSVSRIHNDKSDDRDVYVIVFTNLNDIVKYNKKSRFV